jgi:hypothetical protein
MHGIFFDIGLAVGLAAACGLRPFLPVLLAGALASSNALGVAFAHGHFRFLESSWWLLLVVVALVIAYALQLLLGMAPTLDASAKRPQGQAGQANVSPLAATIVGIAYGTGALLFAGTLDAHGHSPWPGVLMGFTVVAIAQRATGPVFARARARLTERSAREALTVYLDAAALLLAALVAALHPLGYVALALLAWFGWRGRGRSDQKYAGLRILRR